MKGGKKRECRREEREGRRGGKGRIGEVCVGEDREEGRIEEGCVGEGRKEGVTSKREYFHKLILYVGGI